MVDNLELLRLRKIEAMLSKALDHKRFCTARKEIKEAKNLIDKWIAIRAKMPVDTLCEVKDHDDTVWTKRFFKGWFNDEAFFFEDRETSLTAISQNNWDMYRLIDNPWRPWFGGEMPCCGNVMVEYIMRDGETIKGQARALDWSHSPHNDYIDRDYEIIAYRMLGE